MSKDKKSGSGKKPEKPAEKPKVPNLPPGYQPGVGVGGVTGVVVPKLPPEFEPRTGGPTVIPGRNDKF
jgi:hypothetical protein